MFILVSPVIGDTAIRADTDSTMFVPAAAEIERVYGTDYSNQIFNSVSLNSFRNYVIKLTENGSRPSGIPANLGENNIAARNWIADELQAGSNGRIEVEILGHYASVVGRLPGYLPVDAPALMVGGHYDSVGAAAGANDDASGVAATLELARVMSKYNWPLDIYFGAWNAEEIGLLGSTEVSQIFLDRDVELLAYYNVDMLFVPDPEAPAGGDVLMVYPIGYYHQGAYWADLTSMMSQNYGHHMIQPTMSSDFSAWQRSDHWPFVQRGYTALFAHESGGGYDIAYHTPQDTWDNPFYDYQIATETVKAIGGAMAFTMARAYGEPTRHDLSFTLIPSHERNYTVTISTPTTINVTCRWWGGGTSITLYNSLGGQMAQMVDAASSPWEPTTIMSQPAVSPGIYTLSVFNPSRTSIGYEIEVTYETDIDGNDVLDSQEFWFDQEFFSIDSDFDSIDDGREIILGTSRFSNDSDSDSMSDSWEIQYGLDPLDESDAVLDEDSDGLSNLNEFRNNCSPNKEDTDADSIPDLWEVENNLDPTRDDSAEDPDQDGVSNLVEYLEDTDPHFAEFRIERYFVPAIMLGAVAVIAAGAYVIRRRG